MSASEWPRDAYMAKQHRCEIAREPSRVFEPVAPKCGARARWWSDDLASVTVWMCDECFAQSSANSTFPRNARPGLVRSSEPPPP